MPTLNIPAPEYHALKALSAGMIWTMYSECPLKAWIASPWNPDRQPENARHFDIGTAAHLAVLEPADLEARTTIVRGVTKKGEPSPGYASADAKEQREAAYAAGITPLLPEEMVVVQGIQKAIHGHRMARSLFGKGDSEVTLTWEWNGLPCKCRPDHLPVTHGSWMVDLKSAISANPRAIGRKAFNEGWFVRAAWYMAGHKEARGVLPAKYLFVVVEKDPPHMVVVYELDNRALLYGEQIIMQTLDRAAECLRTEKWPGYGDDGITLLELPKWGEFQLAELEVEDAA